MSAPLLEVRGVTHDFAARPGRWGTSTPARRALADVSLSIARGETLALVGESGSGKSTLARTILQLVRPTSGSVWFDGTDLATLAPADLRRMRRQLQVVFQDPLAALDPRLTAFDSIAEALRIHALCAADDLRSRVLTLLDEVGLVGAIADRRPHELSTGQRQRVCIARALAVDPALIVLDEPVSALDVTARGRVLDLLTALQRDRQLSYLFITHDLSVARHVAARVAVLYAGRVVELAPAEAFFAAPAHPYSRLLLDSVPSLDPAHRHTWPLVPAATNDAHRAAGCPFHDRCTHPDRDASCATVTPALEPATGPRRVACTKAGGHR